MDVMLTCDACGTSTGPFGSYQEWDDAARRFGWAIGEEAVLCALCSRVARSWHDKSRPPSEEDGRR